MFENEQSTQHFVEFESQPTPIAVENDGTTPAVPQQDQQQQVEVEENETTKPTRKKKSPLWAFFEECKVPSKKKRGEMECKVKCKACGTLLTRNNSGTTSHWKMHLEQCDYFKLQQKSKLQQQTINFRSLEEAPEVEWLMISVALYSHQRCKLWCVLRVGLETATTTQRIWRMIVIRFLYHQLNLPQQFQWWRAISYYVFSIRMQHAAQEASQGPTQLGQLRKLTVLAIQSN